MPRRPDSTNLGIQLTPAQYAALETAARAAGLTLAAYVRAVLGANVPGFTLDIQQRKRRPHTCPNCEGTGLVIIGFDDNPDIYENIEGDCPRCKGSGLIK